MNIEKSYKNDSRNSDSPIALKKDYTTIAGKTYLISTVDFRPCAREAEDSYIETMVFDVVDGCTVDEVYVKRTEEMVSALDVHNRTVKWFSNPLLMVIGAITKSLRVKLMCIQGRLSTI